MAIHAICPNIGCRKILELSENARGQVVTCRYCTMQFRVPAVRQAAVVAPVIAAPSHQPVKIVK